MNGLARGARMAMIIPVQNGRLLFPFSTQLCYNKENVRSMEECFRSVLQMKGETRMTHVLQPDSLTLGVCYYPEHWPEDLWEDDLLRMKAHGIQVVRVAEFAWALFEPEEGTFCFDLFDRFLDVAQKHDMKVIFCTPTATPPAWLTHRYPDTLNARRDGTLYRHGLRRHYNYNSENYRRLTANIVRALGEHYGQHPQIIGWQIDNELNCETDEFHSEADHAAFRQYMKDKYQTLDNLNEKMGSVVWSQTYTDWDQLHLCRPTVGDSFNPHIEMEEKRFFSWSAVRYCRLQTDLLRPLIGDRFITTNGIFRHLDYTQLMDGSLDFLCFDSYPNFSLDLTRKPDSADDLRDRWSGVSLSGVRGLSPRFGIMEQQSGANGWTGRMEAPMPRPGQMRLWTLQSIAHGADFISYFRWRTAPVGTEIYWHGILDYDNAPNRRLNEVGQIAQDLQKLAPVAGSRYAAKVGFLRDYANEWDAELDRWHGRVHWQSLNGWFAACQHSHTPMDYVYLTEKTTVEDLLPYALLVYPHATILTKETAELLEAYLRQGGKVVFGARTGYKDVYGRCPMRPMAGYAGELCAARVADYTFVGPFDQPGAARWGEDALEMAVFNDVLEPTAEDAVVEATYTSNYYSGQPAVISRAVGKGRAYYFGAAFSEQAARQLMQKLHLLSPLQQVISIPAACELALRTKDGASFLFVLNYTRQPQTIQLHEPMHNLLTGEMDSGETTLPAFGVAVYRTQTL